MSLKRDNTGFTIVELMIASVVFSVLLLIASAAVIVIGRQFHKGIVMARTEEAARNITEEISQDLRFATSDPNLGPAPSVTPATVYRLCIGGKTYFFQRFVQQTGSSAVLRSTEGGCNTSDVPPFSFPSGGRELLGNKMRLADLNITEVAGSAGQTWHLRVKVAYGDDDVLDNPTDANMQCNGGTASQFCAVSEHNVTVSKRL